MFHRFNDAHVLILLLLLGYTCTFICSYMYSFECENCHILYKNLANCIDYYSPLVSTLVEWYWFCYNKCEKWPNISDGTLDCCGLVEDNVEQYAQCH